LPGPFPRPHEASRAHTPCHQTIPTSSFDAVRQRRHHAPGPHRSFRPRPVTAARFCALPSPHGHSRRSLCFAMIPHASTFPRPGIAVRAFRGSRRSGTMRALTPGCARTPDRSLHLSCSAFRTSRPQPSRAARTSISQSPQRVRPALADQASPSTCRLAATPRRSGFVIPGSSLGQALRAIRSPRVASHPASRPRSCLRLHEM
jgi:hypothetical protein